MRTLQRAAAALAIAAMTLVGPVSAATSGPATVAQASQQGTISGRIVDQRGNPLAGATIEATGAGTRTTATTVEDGSYQLKVPPGVYSLSVSKGGYQGASTDGVTVGAVAVTADVTLNDANLQSLQVIGRTSSTASSNRSNFNISESSVSTLPNLEIGVRQNNNLTDTVATLPGVFASRTFSATPNTNFVVRGGALQTRVTVDGHPISSGIAGQWNTNYAVSGIFNDVEVVKGAGLNGSIAGESAVGTVNLRTRDFTAKNSAGVQIGEDTYAGGFYNAYADVNFFGDHASLIVAKSFNGYNGPWNGVYADRVGATSAIVAGQGAVPQIIGLDQWQGDYSNKYSLEGELAKLRWRFSENTSLTFEFLGLQGQYQPQGGAYGTYNGQLTLQACQNGAVFSATLAGCTASSLYTAPYTFGAIGTTVAGYTWFPNSYIQNNEPHFAAEFRTSIKDDTILFRPYTHLINRFISGVSENQYPGNGGGWYAVTNVANCQAIFVAPGAKGGPATGAAGPCFTPAVGIGSVPYIGTANPVGTVFATTSAAPVCSAVAPFTCYTTKTAPENDGLFGYGTPFSQPELDRLNGYTFSWIHPAGDNVYNLSLDYRKDFAQSASTDQTAPAPGCSLVIGSVTGVRSSTSPILPNISNTIDNNGNPYQPTCTTAAFNTNAALSPYATYNLLPRSAIGTPPTVSQYTDAALTGQFRLTDKVRASVGAYYELYKLNAQIEDPAVLAAYAARGNSSAAPVALISATQSYPHFDPHVGFEYRYSPSLSFRVSGGSSITQPYPGLVSGFGSISIPNAAAHNYTVSLPNFNLQPETTVAYDAGFDKRTGDGTVISVDGYYNVVHNVFLSNTTQIPAVAGVATFGDTLFLQSQQINGPLQRLMGVELAATSNPRVGLGYYASASVARSFYDQLPSSIYASNTTAANGNFNITGAQIFGYPFFKSYSQLFYNGPRGEQYAFGMDWEGQDNSTLGPPYTIFDMSAKYPIAKRVFAQLTAQNLFNFGTLTALGRNLSGQGLFEPTVYLTPATGAVTYSQSSTSLQALPPQTFRFSLSYTP